MKLDPTQCGPLWAKVSGMALSALLLSACGAKPPACADQKTLEVAKSILMNRWKTLFVQDHLQSSYELTNEQVAKFQEAVKIDVKEIVSDGYNAEAKKYACSGKFVIETLPGITISGSRRFATQLMADGSDFVVEIEEVDPLVKKLHGAVNKYKAELLEGKAAGQR